MRILAIVVIALLLITPTFAQSTQPAPADEQAASKISPAAQEVLDGIKSGYSDLKSLQVSGDVSINLDAAGDKEAKTTSFTGTFEAPAKFRHEMQGDVLLVSNGEKANFFMIDTKKFATFDAPTARTALGDLPGDFTMALTLQNPSILLALLPDPSTGLTNIGDTIEREADVTLDGKSFQALRIKTDGQDVLALVDPQTHLLRQLAVDVKSRLVNKGVPDVKNAMITINYKTSQKDAAIPADAFAWTPPADAIEVKPGSSAGAVGNEEIMALIGQPAPAFSLKNEQGDTVSLESLKGKVVVLDFWATWCGPCRISLPYLDALNKDLAPKGAKIFAVNCGETLEQAQSYFKSQNLTVPILLDPESNVENAYKISGIPSTIIIGKDGIVKKVFVGFGPGLENEIRAQVEAALK
jgi:thiol-disulfide isomerase/thioredoxin/outer membrane lipoprotein-sorting protein